MAASRRPLGTTLGYRVIGFFYRLLGYGFVTVLSRFIVFYYFLFSPRVVASSMGFYRALFPEAGRLRRWVWAWRQFRSFTTVFVDRFLIESGHQDRLSLTHEGLDSITGAAAARRPTILWMSHLGNWEVAVHCLKQFDVPITLVLGKLVGERIEALQKLALARRRIKVVLVEEGQDLGAVEVIKTLRDGEVVAISGDRLFGDQRAVEVEFLGRRCRVPVGPYVLAGLTGAEIIQIFGLRQGRLAYRFVALPPEAVSFADRAGRQVAIAGCAQRCFDRMAGLLRSYPEQWYNFFNYWPR